MPLKQEIFRKIFHLLLIIIPIAFIKIGKQDFLKIFAPITMAVILFDYLRIKFNHVNENFVIIFKIIMRDKEINHRKFSGMSWAFGSALINFALFDKVIAVTGFFILIFADAMAAIIGKSIKSAPFYNKSRAGSLAFFSTAVLVIIFCGIYFNCHMLFYLFAIAIATFVTYLEAHPDSSIIDDNFLIPFAFGVLMTLMNFMWHIL